MKKKLTETLLWTQEIESLEELWMNTEWNIETHKLNYINWKKRAKNK